MNSPIIWDWWRTYKDWVIENVSGYRSKRPMIKIPINVGYSSYAVLEYDFRTQLITLDGTIVQGNQ